MRFLHISLNTTHSECKPSSSISSFTHSLQVFLPLPAHLTPATTTFLQADTQSSPFLRSTCQATSIYHALPPQPRSQSPKNCTNPHCTSYPSATLRTSISPSSVTFSRDFADLQPSSPRLQSNMSIHSGHKPCISFPLCDMMPPSCQDRR